MIAVTKCYLCELRELRQLGHGGVRPPAGLAVGHLYIIIIIIIIIISSVSHQGEGEREEGEGDGAQLSEGGARVLELLSVPGQQQVDLEQQLGGVLTQHQYHYHCSTMLLHWNQKPLKSFLFLCNSIAYIVLRC